jgi:hypothetical protein
MIIISLSLNAGDETMPLNVDRRGRSMKAALGVAAGTITASRDDEVS